jgi:hypothetical protein
MVSALSSRRTRASWWSDDSFAIVEKMNKEIIPHYYKAKLAADETLTVLGEERRKKDKDFQYIDFRPGGLSDEPATGKISLGKTAAKGMVTRGDVAEVGVKLLERDDTSGWFDLLSGNESVDEAINRVVKEGVNSIEGEDISTMTA